MIKVNDEFVRNLRRPEVRTPRRRWNPEKCVPLRWLLWALAGIIGGLCLAPMFLYFAKGVMK